MTCPGSWDPESDRAGRHQLVGQFLGEAYLLSGCFAILFAQLALPEFNALVERQLSISARAIFPFICLVLFVRVAAGLYPAFYLSAFQPSKTIKSQVFEPGSLGIRKGLVVFEFAISSILVIGTLTISRQVTYVANRDLGFDKDHVITMPIFSQSQWAFADRADAVKAAFFRHSDVKVASVNHAWAVMNANPTMMSFPDGGTYSVSRGWGDEDVWDVYGLEIVQGRGHRNGAEYVVNETGARLFGEEGALGQHIDTAAGDSPGTIVGVVKDYHFQSMHHGIGPMFIQGLRG